MKQFAACLMLLVSQLCHSQSVKPITLHLVGDSTMSDKPNLAYPERGWGQLLPNFVLPQLHIRNHARNGRSTKRFVDEGRWQAMLSELNPGDYVLVQFGHNDQKKSDPARYADVKTDYPRNLAEFIEDVVARHATPILASSICRRHFDDEGALKRTLTDYAHAARDVAAKNEVYFVDLNRITCAFLQDIGDVSSRQYFISVPEGLYAKFPEGKTDNTHLNVQGASKVAQMFVRQLIQDRHPLSEFVYRELL